MCFLNFPYLTSLIPYKMPLSTIYQTTALTCHVSLLSSLPSRWVWTCGFHHHQKRFRKDGETRVQLGSPGTDTCAWEACLCWGRGVSEKGHDEGDKEGISKMRSLGMSELTNIAGELRACGYSEKERTYKSTDKHILTCCDAHKRVCSTFQTTAFQIQDWL